MKSKTKFFYTGDESAIDAFINKHDFLDVKIAVSSTNGSTVVVVTVLVSDDSE